MPTPIEIVEDFIELWGQPGGFAEAVARYFTATTTWENHGLITTTGPAEAFAFVESFGGQTGMASTRIETLAIAATGDKVLTERIDYILGADGKPVMTVPVMGIFEIADGKITAWREYFDTAGNSPK